MYLTQVELKFAPWRAVSARRGLSMLELLGCILAIAVGIWVGTAYLGVDLQAAWQTGMEKSGVAKSPGESFDAAIAGELDPTGESTPALATPSADLDAVASDGSAHHSALTAATQTLAYWTKLGLITQHAQQLQQQGEQQARGNLRAALQARGEAYRNAAANVRQLTPDGIDPEAVQLAQELAAWYERGAELSHEGVSLLDAGDLASGSGPLGRRWHTAEKQHREELNLLNRKTSSLQGKLITRYRLPFPELP